MAFYKAKFEGPCALESCKTKIKIGDHIVWNPKSKPVKYYHLACMEKLKAARGGEAPAPAAPTPDAEGPWMKAPRNVVAGMRCRINGKETGVIYSVGAPQKDNELTIKRDDGIHGGGVTIAEAPYNGAHGYYVILEARGWGYGLEVIGVGGVPKMPDGKPWHDTPSSDESESAGEGKGGGEPKDRSEDRGLRGDPKANGNGNGHGKQDDKMRQLAEMIQPYLKTGVDEETLKKAMDGALGPRDEAIKKTVDDALEEMKKAAVKGGGVLSVEIKRPDEKEVKRIDGVHKDFESLLKLIQVGDHVYMWGPPGSGKSTAARQVSEALGIEFGYISLNPQTPDSRILGYLDAGGHYRSTVFRKMYEEGGVMCIDEMDNAAPSLCVTINSGLESDLMAFPDRMVKRSPKFVLVATGNTTGRGANASYPERRPFDSAFAERFTFLEWNYDEALERAIALAFNKKADKWVDWIQKVREYCKKSHPRLVVSPRASFKGAKLMEKFKHDEVAEMVLFKGMDRDAVRAISKAVPS